MPKTYYITTAIDYPNAPPHIGQAYEKVIADMLARWHQLKREEVFFLTGTDEHGQKIERTAKEAGKTPQKFADEMAEKFKALCTKLNIRNDHFIRTTDKRHILTVQEIWNKVFDKGLIYKGTYEGLYCTGCEAFYTEKDLVDGKCPTHQRKVEHVSEESYFFKMSEFQDTLLTHINQHPDFIQPESRRNEILNRLKEPLKDLSVSRTSFKWGIPVPQDKKHIMYVWFDALTNYLSGVGYGTRKFDKFWPAQCQVIGKDIAWFHTVIWPSILLAAEFPLPKTIYCHGWLTVNGQKMSKTLGNVIDPLYLIDTYGADPLRYTLLRDVPAGEDGDFSEDALIERNNSDLADALGNLLQRTSVLLQKNFKGNIPICGPLTRAENDLNDEIPDMQTLHDLMDNYKWHHAIEKIWAYIHAINKYINDTAPWKQTHDPERLGTILYTVVEHLRIVSILTWPFIPASAEKITAQIAQPLGTFKDVDFRTNTAGSINEPQILFKKMEKQEEDPFATLNLKVAQIKKVENHPDADKLYVLTLDMGEKRQLVAGIKPYYKPEELEGKKIVIISNLKPAKLRGIESQGMLLAAEKDGVVKVLEPDGEPGDQVYVEGITPGTAQITIDDFAKIKLTTKDGKAVYNEKTLRTKKGDVAADIADNAKIR